MVDLLVGDDRQRGTKALLLAVAALLLPWSPGGGAGAEEPELCPPDLTGADVASVADCPDKEPSSPPQEPTFDDFDGADDQPDQPQPPQTPDSSQPPAGDGEPTDDGQPAASGDDAPPALPPAQWTPPEEFGAQGEQPQEVVAPTAEDPAATEAAAAGEPAEVPPADLGLNLAPSLQTAVQPLTDLDSTYRGTTAVPAPLVAGDGAPLPQSAAAPSGGDGAPAPSKAIVYSAALTLETLEPNLTATLVALAVLGGAALLGALGQRRSAAPEPARGLSPVGVRVRPATLPEWAGRSVRPVDHMQGGSVRPRQ